MGIFTRPEPLIVMGMFWLIVAFNGGEGMGRTGAGGFGIGLFLMLKGWEELLRPRSPRLAGMLWMASLCGLLVCVVDILADWL